MQSKFRAPCFFLGPWDLTLARPFTAICSAASCWPRSVCLRPATSRGRFLICRSSGQTFAVRLRRSPSKGGSSSVACCEMKFMIRIVSLVPSITEALCMLCLADSIVGVTDFCTAPAQALRQKARLGGTKNPDLRRVTELRPDLVIVNTDENRLATAQELEALGLKILVTQTDSLDQVEAAWTQLGEANGPQALAARERDRISWARERNPQRLQPEPRLNALIKT